MPKQILLETKITLVKRSPDPNTALSQNWIKKNRETYRGRWVVLKGDRLLAEASSSEELLKHLDPKDGKGKFISLVY
jgi:hypothetical protein